MLSGTRHRVGFRTGLVVPIIVVALVMAMPRSGKAGLLPYTQNFESLGAGDAAALSNDGWQVFGNVFSPDHSTYYYGYGPFPAPNGGPGFSSIAAGEQGANQGTQYLNVYSDYNNSAQPYALIEANVFQQQTVDAADIGKTFNFTFDYKASSAYGPGGGTTTFAFIKVLDPNNGYNLVAYPVLETTNASTSTWSNGNTLSVTIGSGWTGDIVQFGFLSNTTNYQNSGVYYDNVSFSAVPEPASLGLLALGGLVALRRRPR